MKRRPRIHRKRNRHWNSGFLFVCKRRTNQRVEFYACDMCMCVWDKCVGTCMCCNRSFLFRLFSRFKTLLFLAVPLVCFIFFLRKNVRWSHVEFWRMKFPFDRLTLACQFSCCFFPGIRHFFPTYGLVNECIAKIPIFSVRDAYTHTLVYFHSC